MSQSVNQKGAVSIFVVVFTTLLVSIVTISFIQLMIRGQQEAATNDLSQSAYDSALAGVEDAKRVLLLDKACQAGKAAPAVDCAAITTALNAQKCSTVRDSKLITSGTGAETLIQQSTGDAKLDQAYTCVKIQKATNDYPKTIGLNESIIVPLKPTATVSKVRISWFTSSDSQTKPATYPDVGPVDLPPVGTTWGRADNTTPALLRAQYMGITQPNTSYSTFDDDEARTLFLYPTSSGLPSLNFTTDGRRTGPQEPKQVQCRTDILSGGYACSVDIDLPHAISPAVTAPALLRLSALYNASTVQVQMLNSAGTVVDFDNVLPLVDSTGRANDMFRRVAARVTLEPNVPYPAAEIDLTGDLCKNFTVTDTAYISGASPACNP